MWGVPKEGGLLSVWPGAGGSRGTPTPPASFNLLPPCHPLGPVCAHQVLQLRDAVLRRHAVHVVPVDLTGAGLDEAWSWLRDQVLKAGVA